MFEGQPPRGQVAIIGDVGRKGLRLAFTDEFGRFRPETARTFDPTSTTTISGAITQFARASGGPMPRHCALAVAGLARGDAISITNSRWFVSRTGLTAMFQHPPLIINDFAAQAWALTGAEQRAFDPISGELQLASGSGCWVVLGMTSGLGVAVLSRNELGNYSVLPTEAGHSCFVSCSREIADLVAEIFPDRYPVLAEQIISGPGLVTIYNGLARRRNARQATTPEEITGRMAADPVARDACELVARAFWSFAGNIALSHGAWDGVIVTGRVAAALRSVLRRPDIQAPFVVPGKYRRQLTDIPRSFASIDHCELVGVAQALRHSLTVPLPALG
jgi:glucokinase